MGIGTWQDMPVVTGEKWCGVTYFTTLRLSADHDAVSGSATAAVGASSGPYSSLNFGDHVGDEAFAVRRNREQLARVLPQNPLWLNQVHGVDVLDGDKAVDIDVTPVADAAVSSQPNKVLCIMTADCLPVVIADTQGMVVGVAHAGWRGLAAGVLENTLQALRDKAPKVREWRAWIGPAIGQPAFEVGADVRSAFVDDDVNTASFFASARNQPGKWQADLAGLASYRLSLAGVSRIELSGLCTFRHNDLLYSYRRDGQTGRMATVAWLNTLANYPD